MKAVSIQRFGGNEVVEIVNMPKPIPGKGDVLVKVAYAGVNPLDWKVRSGQLKMVVGRKFPKVLGTECSGIVEAVGEDVTKFRPGDRVIGHADMTGGCYADYFLRPQDKFFPIPDHLPLKDAAAVFVVGMSAWQCLFSGGNLKPGDHVFIIGASGGVGSFAVQLANYHGIEVTGVCSGANVGFVKSLGASHVIDYQKENIFTTDQQYNMVFDTVNVASFSRAKKMLTSNGVYMNTLPGPAIFLTVLWTAIFSKRKCKTLMLKPSASDMSKILDLVADQHIKMHIQDTWPFEKVSDAIAASETMRTRGKALIEIDGTLK